MTNNAGEHLRMGAGLGRLTGKVAVVTGAESGIGRATSRLFAREGAKVVCTDIAERGDPRTDRLIEADGGEAHFLLGDVSQKAVCEEMVSAAIDRFGGLDVVFLNAGTGVRQKIHEMSDEAWDHVINLNLYGVYHGVRAALPHF
ncbi:MAG: SDR family NAD(P)-dependent oxidoreductase, partial [Chloroflexi bacterium]|nr:SDR family NAD(P)-dependent oxidoreductase [Chloroflexota bacterium]